MFKVVCILFAFLVIQGGAFAQPESEHDFKEVIIGFEDRPGQAELEIIDEAKGEIDQEFEIINAVSAKIPEPAVQGMENAEGIDYVEPDYEAQTLQTIPWGIEQINADQAWDEATGTGIDVAILDTGIDYGHQDLEVVDGVNTVDGGDYMDYNGHGTHVAGTVAALDNNSGVVGVAPDANLFAGKVLDDDGSGTTSDIVAGIEWAINNDMDIINMSLGMSQYSTALEDVCDEAYYQEDILVVAAAGNDGEGWWWDPDTINYPANYDSVIAVGATDQNNDRANFSSVGDNLEIMAPGVDVLSTVPGNDYDEYDGTSMASPHIAGVAALLMDQGVYTSPAEVRDRMNDTADELGDPFYYGNGIVNTTEALDIH
ncbi:S8 family peptidase [Natranaerobius thermophilus]|uniref:Peptidase S8 and S53 subtilisin kexin sedolisin n=1 Tax=Natranaerobius thermophilus (strain ATCC BAA-1301 / DSM 18059 / JW/NM-WN-LF) TaxID=457570 RepID=B2A7K0_NATTJ|nr:S8 family peptidase [Natranaerobius thermophilus]ACB85709.1 peptidase S8 and S53 subtilisin kexin sedolisin [Natranaerobius thermophilus JW/NM-WN-LF]